MQTVKLLESGIAKIGIDTDLRKIDLLVKYLELLVKWNKTINLVAKAPVADLIETHFIDSLTLLPLINAGDNSLLDIGSGAGFPGLPIKIYRDDLAVTLAEPRQKRVSFLKQVIRTLQLSQTTVLAGRLETNDTDNINLHGGFAIVTSRAFTSIKPFLEIATQFNLPGGKAICMKGEKYKAEIKAWRQESPDSPYTLSKISKIELPFSRKPRKLIVFTRQ